MKRKLLFILLVLIPFVGFGHVRGQISVHIAFAFYVVSYFLIGYLQNEFFKEKIYHIITVASLVLYNVHLISEKYSYFPVYVPTLLILGGLSYFFGVRYLEYSNFRKVLFTIGMGSLIFIWTYYFEPYQSYTRLVNSSEYSYLEGQKVDLKFKSLDGEVFDEDYFKNKTVILDFWFTKCGWCFDKFPFFDSLYNHYENNPNVVIASVVPGAIDSVDDIREVLKEYPLASPVFYDSASVIIKKYEFAKLGYPFEVRIDSNGIVRQTVRGVHNYKNYRSIYIEKSIEYINSLTK